MVDVRLLVIDPAKRFPESLPESFRDRGSRLSAELNSRVSRALESLRSSEVDVVVTSAETDDELAVVSRVRRAHPRLPILVVTSDPEGPLAARAVEAGATGVLPRKAQYQDMLDTLELAVQVSAGIRRNQESSRRSHRLALEVGRLADSLRARTYEALARVGRASTTCVPLLVDADVAAVRDFRAAFAELDPSIPFLAFPSTEEARAHLDRHPPGQPLWPSVFLVDLSAEGEPFALLSWLVARPERPRVLVFAEKAEERARALALGAHDCPSKPATPAGLLGLARRLRDRDAQ